MKKSPDKSQERIIDPRKESALIKEASSEQSKIESSVLTGENYNNKKGICKKIKFKWVC